MHFLWINLFNSHRHLPRQVLSPSSFYTCGGRRHLAICLKSLSYKWQNHNLSLALKSNVIKRGLLFLLSFQGAPQWQRLERWSPEMEGEPGDIPADVLRDCLLPTQPAGFTVWQPPTCLHAQLPSMRKVIYDTGKINYTEPESCSSYLAGTDPKWALGTPLRQWCL